MKKIILTTLLVFLWNGFSGAQHIRTLVPEAPPGKEVMGREYIPLQSGNLSLELGFDGFFGDYLVFDLVVVNQGSEAVMLDPDDFHYLLLEHAHADSSLLPGFGAVDPGLILEQYRQLLGQRKSEQNLNTFLGVLEAGVGILGAAGAFAATDDPAIIVDAVFATVGTAAHYGGQNQALGRQMNRLGDERDLMEKEVMRAGSIEAGEVKSGFVFFPVFDQPGHLMFCFPLSDQLFQFVYRQEG